MNVPEALRASENAINAFRKAVAVASEELEEEMRRIHIALLEEQPKAVEMIPERSRHP